MVPSLHGLAVAHHEAWSVMRDTTARSWLTKRSAMSRSRDQAVEEAEHLGLDGHVERGRGLVRDEQPRPAGQGHRDGHPLPLPAGDLVGARRGDALGLRQVHLLERRERRPA